MDLTRLAVELLDRLPANRTLGLSIVEATDGIGKAVLPVADFVHNVIGALHSSGIAALVDAAALSAMLSVAPDESTARRLQPLGIEARLSFERPIRGSRPSLSSTVTTHRRRLEASSTGLSGSRRHDRLSMARLDTRLRLRTTCSEPSEPTQAAPAPPLAALARLSRKPGGRSSLINK